MAWSARWWAVLARAAQARVRSTAWRRTAGSAGSARAHVERHLDVGAELFLHGDRPLGREPVAGAVVGRPEGHAVVVHVGPQGEDLVAAGVGQEMATPAGEAVETAEGGDRLGARTEHEVVGVGEHDLGAQPLEVHHRQGADHAAGADRHEAGRGESAPRRVDQPGAGRTVGGPDLHPGPPHRRRRWGDHPVAHRHSGPGRAVTGPPAGRRAWRRRRTGTGTPRPGPGRTATATSGRRRPPAGPAATTGAGGSW